jgi:UDP:flavonoid glycosyltransferase YjiC (YdhE family)
MATPKKTQETKVAWFDERPIEGQIPDSARRLLETYSGIAPDAIVQHIIDIRNEAWRVHPYPCIGQVCQNFSSN